jgi:nicotinate phosphoribosyltransferase
LSALLTDYYQLTMLEAYLDEGLEDVAVFELFVRRLPPQRNFLVAAGLEQAAEYLETLRFDADELAWLRTQGFSPRLLERLGAFRFEGDVDAMPEGTVCFAGEPILRVRAPLWQAQFVESRVLNLVHFQTLIASKAARCVLAADGRLLVDFGLRRAHGAEAALLAARASRLAGFAGTATTEAGRRFGIPLFGTMAHSFVQAHDAEQAAFDAFVRAHPARPTLLVDTYDTEAAVESLIAHGTRPGGVRLDSGDLAAHARTVRALLDAAGWHDVTIFASGNLDEQRIAALLAQGAPIDGFGVGTALDVSADAPSLDAVYKLQSYAGAARRKRSEGKATWPGVKQVCRSVDAQGIFSGDTIGLADEAAHGEPLLQPAMRQGQRVAALPSLEQARAHHAEQMRRLPPPLRELGPAPEAYPVAISPAIVDLARRIDARGC